MDIAKLLIPKQETMTPPRDEASRLVSLPPLTSEAHPPPRRRVTLVRSKQQQAAPPSPTQRHSMLGRITKPSSRPPKRRVILMRTQQQQHRGSVSEPPPCSPPKRRRVIIVRGQGTAAAAAAAEAVASARNHSKTEVPVKFGAVAAEWRKVSEGKAACTEAAVVVSAGRANPGNARGDASQPSVMTRSGRISRPPARFVP
ncbi:hypothetical protein MY8738_005648 [Beauveria namnaoensis]